METEGLILATVALVVLVQSLLGWRWFLALVVPLVVLVARRPVAAGLLWVVGGW